MTLKKGALYLLGSIYENRVYRIYRINIAQYHQPQDLNGNHVTFKCLDKNDDDAIKQIVDMEEWLEDQITPNLAAGNTLCVAALHGKIVVGFNLLAFEKVYVPLINRTITLRNGTAWSEQITILRAYRKQGLGTALRHHVFEELKKRGIKKLYGATLVHNKASLKLASKTGFKFLADIHYIKLFGAKKWIRDRRNYENHRADIGSVVTLEP